MEAMVLDITVKYKFPSNFQPKLLEGYAKMLKDAINSFNLAQKLLDLDSTDMSTEIEGHLHKLITEIRTFEHNNVVLIKDPLPYTTAKKAEVVELRKQIHNDVYDLIGRYDDALVSIKLQAFRLMEFATHQSNTTVEHLNAKGDKVESTASMSSKMALANLQLINWFFDSLIKSNPMKALADGLDVIEHVEPTVAFGSKEFTDHDLEKAIPSKQALAF